MTADEQGRFTALLGATKPEGLPLDLFSTDEARWLGVQAQLPGEDEQARVLLVSVPYALKAADAETLGGKPASAYVLADPSPDNPSRDPRPRSGRGREGAGNSAAPDGSDPKSKPSLNKAAVTGGTQDTLGKFDADGVSLINSALKESGGKLGLGIVPDYTFDLQAGAGAQNLLRFFRTGENIFTMSADANENAALFLADGAGAAKVKLGTADGDFRLDMNAGTGAQSVIRVFRLGENIFNFSTDANEHGILFLSDGSGSNTIKLHMAGDSSFTSGNLGLGTTTPNFKLDVQGGQINALGGLCMAGDCRANWAAVGGGTVTSLSQGTGIDLTPDTITSTGTIAIDTAVVPRLNAANSFTDTQTISGGNLALPNTAGSTTGLITRGGNRFLHNFGASNTFVGTNAGNFTMTGADNTASGTSALTSNTTGNNNTATGEEALFSNTTGDGNTATAKPTCSATVRGTFWVTQNTAGVKDSVEVCAKDAFDAYAWRTIYQKKGVRSQKKNRSFASLRAGAARIC